MRDEKKPEPVKVTDKRRFAMDADGNVVEREPDIETERPPKTAPDMAAAEAAARAAYEAATGPDPAPHKSDEERSREFEENCKTCETDDHDLPPIDFMSFVFSLSTTAMMFLGLLPAPDGQAVERDLAMAKQHIDILGLLEEKTRGNLDSQEATFLRNSLYDLRLRFVEACREQGER